MTIRRVFTGKNVQEATAVALETLGAELEDVDIRVLNPGRAGIFGLGGALAEIEVAKLSDVIAEEAMEAAERQKQMDEATGVVEASSSRQPRQNRTRQRRERPSRSQPQSSEQEETSDPTAPRRERPAPRRNRQPAPNRQRRQRRPNQRQRQERRHSDQSRSQPVEQSAPVEVNEPDSRAEEPIRERQEPVVEPIQNREELEATTGEVLGYLIAAMNVDVEAYVLDDLRDGSLVFEIEGADAGLLIGRRGETLRDLQFIVRMLVNRQLKQRANIIIDVERYQLRRTQKLHTIAENAARAASRGRARSLDPMSAEERRIVHIALSDNPQVVTESEGQGTERHVVVRPR